jgi:iron complex transport system substrate-binding protein
VTEDIEASSHGSNFGFEALLEFDPQVLFVIDRTAAVGDKSNIKKDMENDIVKKTEAYKNKKIVYLDGPLWYLSGGGLQSELAKIEEVLAELK